MENIELLIKQANSGDAMSQYKLGRAYEIGDGVEKNVNTARIWYLKAAENGYKNAEVKLRLLPIQEIASNQAVNNEATSVQSYQAPPAPHFTTPGIVRENADSNQHFKQTVNMPQTGNSQKSKTVAIILALFLGCYGVHDFYLGYNKQGIIKLVLTFTIIGSFISAIWSLIDFVKILCNGKPDSNGQFLK